MAPEGSLPCSQEPTIGSYPESDESSPHPLSVTSFLYQGYPPIYRQVPQVAPSPKQLEISLFPHARFMSSKFHPPLI
jgi:hypothetical protein